MSSVAICFYLVICIVAVLVICINVIIFYCFAEKEHNDGSTKGKEKAI